MRHTPRPIKVRECVECTDVFMTIGSVKIGLAFPRHVGSEYNPETGHVEKAVGLCPKHRKKVGHPE